MTKICAFDQKMHFLCTCIFLEKPIFFLLKFFVLIEDQITYLMVLGWSRTYLFEARKKIHKFYWWKIFVYTFGNFKQCRFKHYPSFSITQEQRRRRRRFLFHSGCFFKVNFSCLSLLGCVKNIIINNYFFLFLHL